MYILLLAVGFIVWCLFFAKHHGIGKFIYEKALLLDMRMVKLFPVERSNNGEQYSYLTNHEPTKPPMILLHGFSADKNIWLKFAKHAAKDYNLFIPDLMGHGDIAYNKQQNYSAFEQAKYVTRFMTMLKIDKPMSIVGNSMGGMIAAILAKDESTFVIDKCVLIDPAGAKTDFALQMKSENYNPFIHATEEDSLAFFEQVMHKPPFVPPAVKLYVAQTQYLAKKDQLAHMFSDFFNPDEFFDEPLTLNAQRTILIWGQEDALLPVTDAQRWEELVACSGSVFAGIGHMPMVECPQQTYSLIH